MKNRANAAFYTCVLFLTSMACAVDAQAQTRLFVTGGPHIATVESSGTNATYNEETAPFLGGRTSLKLGFSADIPFRPQSRWSLQPGIFYSGKGSILEKNFDTTNQQSPFFLQETTQKTDYIEIPVHIAYKIPLSKTKKSSFYLGAGPMVSVFYSAHSVEDTYLSPTDLNPSFRVETVERKGETGTEPGKFKSAYAGVSASAGFDFGGVLVRGDFTRGLTDFQNPSIPGKFVHQTIGGSVSFRIATQKETPSAPPVPSKPADSDNDGIPDEEDACPDEPGSREHNGCPDRDNDGIPDKDDRCPDTKGTAAYNGCPVPDRDGDGINDEMDACPDTPGPARFKGCPVPDTDKDGLNDEEDACPTQPGPKENNGCPVVKEETIKEAEQIAERIQFSFGKTTIEEKYYPLLNQIAELLKSDPALKIRVEGHTDDRGTAERNRIVSQQRANAIRDYLISSGAAAGNITAKGFGPDQPIADNETEEGRARNRRVAFVLYY